MMIRLLAAFRLARALLRLERAKANGADWLVRMSSSWASDYRMVVVLVRLERDGRIYECPRVTGGVVEAAEWAAEMVREK